MNKKLIYFSCVVCTILSLVTLMLWSINSQTSSPSQLKVVTTIFPVYDITQNILTGSNDIKLELLIPSGVSPHTYEPSTKDLQKINEAQVIFIIGQNYDTWAENIAHSQNVKILNLSERANLLTNTDEDEHGEYDPHYWTSISNVKLIASAVKDVIVDLDPQNQTLYEKNYINYIQLLETTLLQAKALLRPGQEIHVVTFHNSLAYFAQELGISVIGTFEPVPGINPTPNQVKFLSETIQQYNVKTIYIEPQLASDMIEPLVLDLDLTIEVLDPLGGGNGRKSFVQTYLYNINTIVNSL